MDDDSHYGVNVLDDDDDDGDRSMRVVVMLLRLSRDQYRHQLGKCGTLPAQKRH